VNKTIKYVWDSMKYVLKENSENLFRIYSISKYEVLADMRDSKLGLFWNFANPVIQCATYFFMFSIVFNRKSVDGITYVWWMLGGMVCWFFINPCITAGANAIFSKINIITKMKFPVSVLPATVVLAKLFDHFCLMIILTVLFITAGYPPTIHWLGLVYYCTCGIVFSISLALTTSVLNMLARDTRKLILAIMRLLLYLTPILWDIKSLPGWMQRIMLSNPIYYVVQGYRDCFFYHKGLLYYKYSAVCFWVFTLAFFMLGSVMMRKFKSKFVDFI